MKEKYVFLYLGDVEGTSDPEFFDTLEEAESCVKEYDKSYTPDSSYWVILKVIEKYEGKFTKKRF